MSDAWMPEARKEVVCRIVGPEEVSGMTTWRVLRRTASGWEQVGGWCFSFAQAASRARDIVSGRKVVYFGHHAFGRKAL